MTGTKGPYHSEKVDCQTGIDDRSGRERRGEARPGSLIVRQRRMQLILQGFSLLGAICILVAFVALQRRWWTSEAPTYLWCNLVGAVLLGVVAVADRRIGFIIIEVVWAVVSLLALIRMSRANQVDHAS